ncbi:MAG: hypothetical protein V2B18_21440 [Pseudomonadota bacterium]
MTSAAGHGDRVQLPYTRVTIRSPAAYFTEDIRFNPGPPVSVSLAFHVTESPLLIWMPYTLTLSWLSGGLAGLMVFGSFRYHSFLGLFNIVPFLGLWFAVRIWGIPGTLGWRSRLFEWVTTYRTMSDAEDRRLRFRFHKWFAFYLLLFVVITMLPVWLYT